MSVAISLCAAGVWMTTMLMLTIDAKAEEVGGLMLLAWVAGGGFVFGLSYAICGEVGVS